MQTWIVIPVLVLLLYTIAIDANSEPAPKPVVVRLFENYLS
jgi:hypothetical protein